MTLTTIHPDLHQTHVQSTPMCNAQRWEGLRNPRSWSIRGCEFAAEVVPSLTLMMRTAMSETRRGLSRFHARRSM
ncbi:hypothetical protein L484_012449 [Morus notabilis]|uniref:Uncharacterized protein n=1 Tax=Morus notabilis TaxID=981085 RepID=W9RBB4_9ROSA|nr:hypothetical protein L484_012449 [Morus notabilis]